MTQLVLPGMLERGWGRIVVISSVWGREAGGAPAYNAAKAGEISFVTSLGARGRFEGRDCQLRRARLDPVGRRRLGPAASSRTPQRMAEFVKREMPLGRFGTVPEVASVVAFLCSRAGEPGQRRVRRGGRGTVALQHLMRRSLALVWSRSCCWSRARAAAASPPSRPRRQSGPQVLNGSIGAAAYAIDVPAALERNAVPLQPRLRRAGSSESRAAPHPIRRSAQWLLDRGYALAGSSYSSTGWAIEDALNDQIALLDYFDAARRQAEARDRDRRARWAASSPPASSRTTRTASPAAMPLCGVLAGGVAAWNTGLDWRLRVQDPARAGLQPAGGAHHRSRRQPRRWRTDLLAQARQTPAGQARIALDGSALRSARLVPADLSPSPRPPTTPAQAAAQAPVGVAHRLRVRVQLPGRAGEAGRRQSFVERGRRLHAPAAALRRSRRGEALYRAAGLDLAGDLRGPERGRDDQADPQAVAYLDRNVSFDGNLSVPGADDAHDRRRAGGAAGRDGVRATWCRSAGKQDLLRQVFVHRAGHCAFTSAEVITLIQAMLKRLDTGRWDDSRADARRAQRVSFGARDQSQHVRRPVRAPRRRSLSSTPGPTRRPSPRGSVAP